MNKLTNSYLAKSLTTRAQLLREQYGEQANGTAVLMEEAATRLKRMEELERFNVNLADEVHALQTNSEGYWKTRADKAELELAEALEKLDSTSQETMDVRP